MAMKNEWMKGSPFNWRGKRDTPVTPHYRYREPGSIGENQKFPPDFGNIFGLPPYNRRMLDAGTSVVERATAHVSYTTAWRDFIGVVNVQAFQPFAEEFASRFDAAINVLSEYCNTEGERIYHTWTGSAKKVSVYKVAFPNAPIFHSVMLTPVPFHCSLAKLLGSEDDEEHRRNAALNVVSEYQGLLIQSGEYVEKLVRLLSVSHLAGVNSRLGREKAEREAAEREDRKAAIDEAAKAAGQPQTLNELLGWVA